MALPVGLTNALRIDLEFHIPILANQTDNGTASSILFVYTNTLPLRKGGTTLALASLILHQSLSSTSVERQSDTPPPPNARTHRFVCPFH